MKPKRNLSSSDSFDESWPQPFENSQRMWSFDRTVTIEKPLVTFPWRSIGFYALTGQSVITFKKRLVKETIVKALEEIREQIAAIGEIETGRFTCQQGTQCIRMRAQPPLEIRPGLGVTGGVLAESGGGCIGIRMEHDAASVGQQ